MGGNKTGEVDALCIMDECSCVYNLVRKKILAMKFSMILTCNTFASVCQTVGFVPIRNFEDEHLVLQHRRNHL